MSVSTDVTWSRLEHHLEQVEAAARDLRTAIAERRPPRVSSAVQVFVSAAFEMARLLGRLDQIREDES